MIFHSRLFRVFAGLVPVLWLAALGGCDFVYRLLDKEGAEEKELVGEVLPFEANPTVEEIQALLRLYGYNPGKVDGKLGPRTREAIARFQKENGLEVSRFVDRETWDMMTVLRKKGLVIGEEVNIELVQMVLKAAGLDSGKVDGKLGKKTQSAVVAFQRQYGLKPDGKIGYRTLSKMAEYIQVE